MDGYQVTIVWRDPERTPERIACAHRPVLEPPGTVVTLPGAPGYADRGKSRSIPLELIQEYRCEPF